MSKLKILFPDNLHFHDRNFKSLLDYIENNQYEKIMMDEYNEIKAIYGNYHKYKSLFLAEYDEVSRLGKNELFSFKILGTNLFSLAKAELLSYLMSKKNWLSCEISSSKKYIFDKAYKENKEDLLLNMAVTLFWLKFWQKSLLSPNYKNINITIIFSGSLIYVKTLSYLLQNTPIKVFVVEHFFTGNDYYFEEKYDHIANNSDIKYYNFYNNLKNEFFKSNNINIDNERIKALNKINLSNNKNVKQPDNQYSKLLMFNNTEKIVLILGQVVNDFSILETDLDNINSLDIYKKMIIKLLKETNYNIIFKAHPWEKNKINLKRSITKDELNSFVMLTFSDKERSRIKIIEDYNIKELFNVSNYIVGICSQSLIEAAYVGKKPHQIGKSFFGEKGFTYDHCNVDVFLERLKEMPNEKLTLNEYQNFLDFMMVVLQKHLVSVYKSGEASIREKLNIYNNIKIVSQKESSYLVPSIKNKDGVALNDNNQLYNEIKDNSFLKAFIENLIVTFASEKKIKKFRENPKRFFADTNHTFVKLLGQLYDK